MKKQIIIDPAFDRRSDDPSKNYGVHGVQIRFVLRDYRGAVQFLLYTNWIPYKKKEGMGWFYIKDDEVGDSMRVELKFNPFVPSFLRKPLPADLGYHSPKPMYEGHKTMTEKCEFIGDKPCYYDGSGLNAFKVFIALIDGGDKGVWDVLQKYHEETFGKLPLSRFFDKVILLYNTALEMVKKKRLEIWTEE